MQGELLISIAREAISDKLHGTHSIDMHKLVEDNHEFTKKMATFVTLTLNGQLRGCIGSVVPHRTLLEDLVSNAQSAAFNDPRFMPLSCEEFDDIKIEVSLLSEPKRFMYESIKELKERVTYADGVILKQGHLQATFLPQVWEQLPTFELFFSHLCEKAGMGEECLREHPEIFLYQVEKFKE